MKQQVIILLFLPILCIASQNSYAECDLDGTQFEMNSCSYERYKKADAELNTLYTQQMARLGKVNQSRLRNAQRVWIKYRDKSCLYEVGKPEESGSIYDLEDNMCLVYFTKQRIKVLERYLQCTENGCPE